MTEKLFLKNSSLVTTGLNMQNISKMQCDELNCQLITTRHMTLFRPLNRPSLFCFVAVCFRQRLPTTTQKADGKTITEKTKTA